MAGARGERGQGRPPLHRYPPHRVTRCSCRWPSLCIALYRPPRFSRHPVEEENARGGVAGSGPWGALHAPGHVTAPPTTARTQLAFRNAQPATMPPCTQGRQTGAPMVTLERPRRVHTHTPQFSAQADNRAAEQRLRHPPTPPPSLQPPPRRPRQRTPPMLPPLLQPLRPPPLLGTFPPTLPSPVGGAAVRGAETAPGRRHVRAYKSGFPRPPRARCLPPFPPPFAHPLSLIPSERWQWVRRRRRAGGGCTCRAALLCTTPHAPTRCGPCSGGAHRAATTPAKRALPPPPPLPRTDGRQQRLHHPIRQRSGSQQAPRNAPHAARAAQRQRGKRCTNREHPHKLESRLRTRQAADAPRTGTAARGAAQTRAYPPPRWS